MDPDYNGRALGEESLARTGYFDAAAVHHRRGLLPGLRPGSARRAALELALGGVVATQLWHHTFFGGLAELPSRAAAWSATRSRVELPSAGRRRALTA